MSQQTTSPQPKTLPTASKTAGRKSTNRKKPALAPQTVTATRETVRHWLSLSRDELDSIYQKARPGQVPQGDTRGTVILAGAPLPGLFALLARRLAWQGKVFDMFGASYENGVVVNKVSPLGLSLIVAKVYEGQSWMDGRKTTVIDYSTTSLLARQIRDEIREVEPGLYLGKVWFGKQRVLDFALETHQPTPQ